MKKTLLSLIGEQDDGRIDSGLVRRVGTAIRKRVCDLDRNDAALLVRHGRGLEYTIPIALDFLEDNLINTKEAYMGELLTSVLSVRKDYWKKNPVLNNRVVEIKSDVLFFLEQSGDLISRLESFEEIW